MRFHDSPIEELLQERFNPPQSIIFKHD